MRKSFLRHIGPVPFAEFTGERIYMLQFYQDIGLPEYIRRWQETVNCMLEGIRTKNPIYLMVDQGHVVAGNTQRRPRPHIDGNWVNGEWKNGPVEPTHITRPPEHISRPSPGPHSHRGLRPEALILASNVGGTRAYVGSYEGEYGDGGDCSHINLSRLSVVDFEPGHAYAGNVEMIHEAIALPFDCDRTVVRLNVPGVEI